MSATAPAGARPHAPALSLPAQALNLAFLAFLLGLGVVGFGPVFGGDAYLIAGFGGILLGLAVAFLGARLGSGLLTVSALTVLGYFTFGGMLALRPTTILGFVPTLDTLQTLALGIVFSWKQLLTVEAPVAGFDTLLVVPFLSALLTAAVAGTLALRSSRPGFALVPVVALFMVSIGFGTHTTILPVLRGIGLAAGAIAWYAWQLGHARSTHARTTAVDSPNHDPSSRLQSRHRRIAAGSAILVLALGTGMVSADAVTPTSARQVLRDSVVPPLDLKDYPSPLVAFRKYVRDYKDKTLFTVSGLPDGARVRLATLDRFDGIVYNVSGDGTAGSGTFARVGTSVVDTRTGTSATITVTVDALTGVWMPDAGYLTSLGFTGTRAAQLTESLHYNRSTGVAVTTLGLLRGDSYTAKVVIPAVPTDAKLATRQAATTSMPLSTFVPEVVATSADAAIGDASTALARVRAIESELHTNGFFSHGLEGEVPSRAGHGAERMNALLGAKQIVGDDEQYAVAMALEVSHLGIPARVVMGFYPKSAATGTSRITGGDIHAWVEVAFDGIGWVSFDPTPPTDQVPQAEQPAPKTQPQAQVLQPPPPLQEPVELPPEILPADKASIENGDVWGVVFAIAGIVGGILGILLVLVGPMLLVGYLKLRRRRRRAAARRPADRLSNGWSEVVDAATDLGATITPGATRREGSVALAERYPETSIAALADRVDTGVFGPVDPTDAQLDEFWEEVDRLVDTMSRSVGRWARLRARLSVRSFRHGWSRRASLFLEKRRTTP